MASPRRGGRTKREHYGTEVEIKNGSLPNSCSAVLELDGKHVGFSTSPVEAGERCTGVWLSSPYRGRPDRVLVKPGPYNTPGNVQQNKCGTMEEFDTSAGDGF
jgi:hypothetical protein